MYNSVTISFVVLIDEVCLINPNKVVSGVS